MKPSLWIQSTHLSTAKKTESFLARVSCKQLQSDYKPLFTEEDVKEILMRQKEELTKQGLV